jgi:hypothetical protein
LKLSFIERRIAGDHSRPAILCFASISISALLCHRTRFSYKVYDFAEVFDISLSGDNPYFTRATIVVDGSSVVYAADVGMKKEMPPIVDGAVVGELAVVIEGAGVVDDLAVPDVVLDSGVVVDGAVVVHGAVLDEAPAVLIDGAVVVDPAIIPEPGRETILKRIIVDGAIVVDGTAVNELVAAVDCAVVFDDGPSLLSDSAVVVDGAVVFELSD